MACRASVLSVALPFPAELDGPDHLFLHDGWIALLAALEGRVIIDQCLLTRYRQHPAGDRDARSADDPGEQPPSRAPATSPMSMPASPWSWRGWPRRRSSWA